MSHLTPSLRRWPLRPLRHLSLPLIRAAHTSSLNAPPSTYAAPPPPPFLSRPPTTAKLSVKTKAKAKAKKTKPDPPRYWDNGNYMRARVDMIIGTQGRPSVSVVEEERLSEEDSLHGHPANGSSVDRHDATPYTLSPLQHTTSENSNLPPPLPTTLETSTSTSHTQPLPPSHPRPRTTPDLTQLNPTPSSPSPSSDPDRLLPSINTPLLPLLLLRSKFSSGPARSQRDYLPVLTAWDKWLEEVCRSRRVGVKVKVDGESKIRFVKGRMGDLRGRRRWGVVGAGGERNRNRNRNRSGRKDITVTLNTPRQLSGVAQNSLNYFLNSLLILSSPSSSHAHAHAPTHSSLSPLTNLRPLDLASYCIDQCLEEGIQVDKKVVARYLGAVGRWGRGREENVLFGVGAGGEGEGEGEGEVDGDGDGRGSGKGVAGKEMEVEGIWDTKGRTARYKALCLRLLSNKLGGVDGTDGMDDMDDHLFSTITHLLLLPTFDSPSSSSSPPTSVSKPGHTAASISSRAMIALAKSYASSSSSPTAPALVSTADDPRTWSPVVVDAVMKAFRLEGDLGGVRTWFEIYREGRKIIRQGGFENGKREMGGGDTGVETWPYLTMLHAVQDSRLKALRAKEEQFNRHGISSGMIPPSVRRRALRRGRKTSPTTGPAAELVAGSIETFKIISSMKADQIPIPLEVYTLCLRQAMEVGDWKAGRKVWEVMRGRLLEEKNGMGLGGVGVVGASRETRVLAVLVGLRFMGSRGWRREMTEKEGGVEGLVIKLLQAAGLPTPGARTMASSSISVETRVSILVAVINISLSHRHLNPSLASWAFNSLGSNQWNIGVDEKAIDAVVHGLVGYAVQGRGRRDRRWIREVLGEEMEEICFAEKGRWRATRTTSEDWDAISRRVYELTNASAGLHDPQLNTMIYLPLSRPFARLESSPFPDPIPSTTMNAWTSARTQTYDYRYWRNSVKAEEHRKNLEAVGRGVGELLRLAVEFEMKERGGGTGMAVVGHGVESGSGSGSGMFGGAGSAGDNGGGDDSGRGNKPPPSSLPPLPPRPKPYRLPILTPSILRPTFYHGPLPRLKPQPVKTSMMIQSRLRARERRQEAQKTWRVWRDDMLMEEWFWGELGVLKREGEEGNVEVASWYDMIDQHLAFIDECFVRDAARAATKIPQKMVDDMKRAHRERTKRLQMKAARRKAKAEREREKGSKGRGPGGGGGSER